MVTLPGLELMRHRRDFLRAARGRKAVMPGFILQAWDRHDAGMIRVGFTCSKKIGNAVARNRAKRRLRALAQSVLPAHGTSGYDYVLIGRLNTTARRDFAQLTTDLQTALKQVSP